VKSYVEHYTIRPVPFRPRDESLLIQHLEAAISLWHVPSDRNKTLRMPVFKIATYFHREMGFDFGQYSTDQLSTTDSAFLFVYTPDIDVYFGIGAACFRWIKCRDAPACYSLEWAWIHPFFRRHRFLSQAWPHFVQRFAPFHVSHPRSEAMQSFLNKIGYVEAIQSSA
jgi:hypothetical protein